MRQAATQRRASQNHCRTKRSESVLTVMTATPLLLLPSAQPTRPPIHECRSKVTVAVLHGNAEQVVVVERVPVGNDVRVVVERLHHRNLSILRARRRQGRGGGENRGGGDFRMSSADVSSNKKTAPNADNFRARRTANKHSDEKLKYHQQTIDSESTNLVLRISSVAGAHPPHKHLFDHQQLAGLNDCTKKAGVSREPYARGRTYIFFWGGRGDFGQIERTSIAPWKPPPTRITIKARRQTPPK